MPRASAVFGGRDVFTLAEAAVSNEHGLSAYYPRQGCRAAAERLVKLGLLSRAPDDPGYYYPTEKGQGVAHALSQMLPILAETAK